MRSGLLMHVPNYHLDTQISASVPFHRIGTFTHSPISPTYRQPIVYCPTRASCHPILWTIEIREYVFGQDTGKLRVRKFHQGTLICWFHVSSRTGNDSCNTLLSPISIFYFFIVQVSSPTNLSYIIFK